MLLKVVCKHIHLATSFDKLGQTRFEIAVIFTLFMKLAALINVNWVYVQIIFRKSLCKCIMYGLLMIV